MTFSAKLDAINILKNEVYNRPETADTPGLLIQNGYDFNAFIGNPETVKIFRTDISLIGESTFAEIFINCEPQKVTDKKKLPKVTILGIGIEYMDKVVRGVKMDKILKPVPSSVLPSAGDKNEIIVDIRLGFSESE